MRRVSSWIAFFALVVVLSPTSAWARKAYLYLASEPLEMTTELGPISRGAHVAAEAGFQLFKAGVVFHATGDPVSALTVLGFESLKSPPEVTVQSIADLKLREWFKRQIKMRELSKVPHLRKVSILTTANIEVDHMIARSWKSEGVVFLETDRPLRDRQPLPAGWGKPIRIRFSKKTRLRLTLKVRGEPDLEWSPLLSDIVSDAPKPMPAEIRREWSEAVGRFDRKNRSWFRRHFVPQKVEDLQIHLSLVGPEGEITRFPKSFAEGPAVESILGRTWTQKALIAAGKTAGKIPVSNYRPGNDCMGRFRALLK